MAATPFAAHWIDGVCVDAGEHRASINPASGEIIGQYALAGAAQAQQAIDAALKAFRTSNWKDEPLLRGRVLNALADAFERRAADLAQILAKENGKTVQQAGFEISSVPRCLRFNAALALTEFGRAMSVETGHLSIVTRQAVGVSGVIAPWNSPVALVIRSLAPALAAGTTVVVMLPGQSAQTNRLMSEIVSHVPELPPGVVNFITGNQDAGNQLVVSPDVPVISFTGGTGTGRTISANAAPHLKRLGLELGGKTPMIILDDADLEAAVVKTVESLIVFAGQFCMTGSRVLVQRAVADQVRQALVEKLGAVRLGPGTDPQTEMGPMIDKPNVERVDKMVQDAIAAGAVPLLRGGPVTEGPLARGSFYRPTLLEASDSSLDIVQKEVFGPVLTLQTFDTDEEAVTLANATQYGLSASVWSRDVDRPFRIARDLESGTVWVNGWADLYDQFEEGGFKQSGVGRMRGLTVIDDFVEFKHVVLKPGVLGR